MLRYIVVFLLFNLTLVWTQSKLGECPEAKNINVCAFTCYQDNHCSGSTKCCRTSCGGLICIPPMPVTSPASYTPPPSQPPALVGKQGSCPIQPTGPWVCTSTCGNDNHCRGSKKCCKNRCGAMACTSPEIN